MLNEDNNTNSACSSQNSVIAGAINQEEIKLIRAKPEFKESSYVS